MKLRKALRAGIAALVMAVLFSALTACVMEDAQVTADTQTSEASIDFDFILNERLMLVYRALGGTRPDFFNLDFREFDLLEGNNFGLIRLAELFLDFEYDEGRIIMNAEELGIFMTEAFGIELPLVTVRFHEYDFYEFDEERGVFIYYGANGGWGLERWVMDSYTENADGSMTITADLYVFGMTYDDADLFFAEIAKPPALWDSSLNWGRAARSEITIIPHDYYRYFPMQIVGIQTERHDWDEAGGTYMSEDGAFILSFGLDQYYRYDDFYLGGRLNVLLTDTERQRDFWIFALIYNNTAEFHVGYYQSLEAFMTLFPDGSIHVSALTDFFGIDFTGTFARISDELPPMPAKFGFEWIWAELDGAEYYSIAYMIPHISRLGDSEFEDFVIMYITDALAASFDEFIESLDEIGENTMFQTRLDIVTVSDFYYALAAFTESYVHGAAHGNYSIRVFNIDTDRGMILTLDDVFIDGYRPILEGILNEMAQSDEYRELLFPDTEITLTDNVEFFLSDNRIVIIFPTYEIGPFSSGIIRFSVPFSEISGILREEYQNRGLTRQISDADLFRE